MWLDIVSKLGISKQISITKRRVVERMYSLLRDTSRRTLILEQAPTMGGSLIIAEVFFKFGSFTLEAIAFLATWIVLDAAVQVVRTLVSDSVTRSHSR